MTYRTFNQLNGKTLKKGDIVILGGKKHETCIGFISNNEEHNDWIFRKTGVNASDFLREAYGYNSFLGSGSWPECKDRDYEALTRAALVLLGFQEGYDVDVQMPYNNWKRFERDSFNYEFIEQRNMVIGDFEAAVTANYVEVGCQDISFNKVEKVYKTMVKLRDKSKK
jgi:hypothetical protein